MSLKKLKLKIFILFLAYLQFFINIRYKLPNILSNI